MTVSAAGYGAVSCTNYSVTGTAGALGPSYWIVSGAANYRSTCDNGESFDFLFAQIAQKNAGLYSVNGSPSSTQQLLPFGATVTYVGRAFAAPFANGSASQPSMITYNNTVIGRAVNGADVTLTGTVNVATPTGGLVTLN